ncbi:tRNA (cmo5U34)-methyltransferase [bacterium BMS3Abin04]|nr:tRNA (cmo5U34)-methyltransferase [bacterium BMS3Abin04]
MKNHWDRDSVFNDSLNKIVDFTFDDKVAKVFEDMLHRSIPGYSTIIGNIGTLTKRYARPGSNLYDLGSSLGAGAIAMQNNLSVPNCTIFAIDNSISMIRRCRSFLKNTSDQNIHLICSDINNIVIKNASIIILNFTLQFIPLDLRDNLIKNIYNGLLQGGILILSEKITFEDEKRDERQIDRYYDFKRKNNYSELEISQKRDALENVLIPEHLEMHFSRLKSAGFINIDQWFQLYNFVSVIAEK